jgi:hypothetical protein
MKRRWWAAGSAVVALVLTGCTSTPTPTARPTIPVFATATATTAPVRAALPHACAEVASASDVDAIVGHQLTGSAAEVRGVAEPAIHRTGRLDCYYGIPAGQPVTAGVLSIGIAGYTDAASAAQRVTETVNAARQAGDSTSDVTLGSRDAVLVVGPRNQELVLSAGDLTVLISADTGVLSRTSSGDQLRRLAGKALASN